MTKGMRQLPGLIICLFLVIVGCSTSDSGGEGSDDLLETQNVSGVWLGGFGSNTLYPKGIFTVGIVTEDREARFIGDNTQFVGPEGSLSVTPNSVVYSGYLVHWSTTGIPSPDYSSYNQRRISISQGIVYTKRLMGYGLYTYDGTPDNGVMTFFAYNTTYDITPDVGDLSGTWEIKDCPRKGETVTLTIEPDAVDPKEATITGSDTLTPSNNFTGKVTIHNGDVTHNVYDVLLRINEGTPGEVTLDGLATYVITTNEDDPDDIKNQIETTTLAIGVSNEDRSYSLSGLATLVSPGPE